MQGAGNKKFHVFLADIQMLYKQRLVQPIGPLLQKHELVLVAIPLRLQRQALRSGHCRL